MLTLVSLAMPRRRLAGAALVLALGLPGEGLLGRAATQGSEPQSPAPDPQLLAAVRENLRRERALLLEYTYHERRRPVRISPLGKVSVGPEQLFEVSPTGDPDRPQRVLLAVGGREATAAERADYAERHARDAPGAGEREESRRRAQERFDDAFRVYRFELRGSEPVDGLPARVVAVVPRPEVETRSDLGKWMKRFRGTAWVSEREAELLRLEMTATGTISLGWGVVGRIAEGTRITYVRRPVGGGAWLPAMARFEARGRTLLFRSFEVDSRTEWFDYRPQAAAGARGPAPQGPLR